MLFCSGQGLLRVPQRRMQRLSSTVVRGKSHQRSKRQRGRECLSNSSSQLRTHIPVVQRTANIHSLVTGQSHCQKCQRGKVLERHSCNSAQERTART